MEIMNRFDIIRIIIDIMKERNYLGSFDIYCTPTSNTNIIVIAITVDNHSISEGLVVDDIKICKNPRYAIRLIINDMINQIRRSTND